MTDTEPDLAERPEVKLALASCEDMLAHGLGIKIDVSTGVMVEMQSPRMVIHVDHLGEADDDARAMLEAPVDMVDMVAASIVDDVGNLAMFAHSGVWRPGEKAGGADTRIVNLGDDRMWRVPYVGGVSLPGCFLKDRRSVVVVGSGIDSATFVLCKIDLTTGENRPIGGEVLSRGTTLFLMLSPDGNKIAALHKTGAEAILETRVVIVDLATDEVRRVGEPLDTAFLSWLPDESGFILVTRENHDVKLPPIETIARLDLDGRVTPIRRGSWPLVLGASGRMLFEDSEDGRRWKTCRLDGADVQPLRDGLVGYGFPTLAPDGRRLLMMKFTDAEAPAPVIVPLDAREAVIPISVSQGLWASPKW